ncbi:unnamed protein product, partial [Vicia faba]
LKSVKPLLSAYLNQTLGINHTSNILFKCIKTMSMNFPTIMDQNNLLLLLLLLHEIIILTENHIYTAENTKENKQNQLTYIVKHSIIFTASLTVTCIFPNFLSSNVSHHSLSHCPCIYLSLLQATYYSQSLIMFT